MTKPNFFIVGAPKSGTSAMNRYLGQHPEIFMPERKEPHFFATDLDSGSASDAPYFVRGEPKYLELFREADGQQHIGEASVFYLYSQGAPRRIKAFAPDAKVIAMLRDPVDMMHALHAQHLSSATEDILDFKSALDAEPIRERGGAMTRHGFTFKCLFYRQVARYAEQLERYVEIFGQDNVHVIVYDDLKRDSASIYRDTLRFLGASTEFEPAFKVFNPGKRVRSMAIRNFLYRPPEWMWNLGKSLLPVQARRQLLQKMWQLNTPPAPRRPMDEALRQALRREFTPQVERLSKMLNRDLVRLWFDPVAEPSPAQVSKYLHNLDEQDAPRADASKRDAADSCC